MKRVLLLGGYGGFGGRIAERLSRDEDFEVTVAGRSLERARAFCDARPSSRLKPAPVDRDGALVGALESLAPWLVIDAAGPFQGADYRVPRACIAARAHYLDIADGRGFVAGVGALDAEAVAAGVVLISGASSVPALSSAVADALTEDMARVSLIKSLITAASRGTGGRSVLEAILSYVGRPIEILQSGRRRVAFGWQAMARETLTVAGRPPLRARLAGLCDVPDLELLSDRYPGRPRVLFRAGGEFGVQNRALWLLSWPARWGWVGSLRGLAPLLAPLLRATQGLGSGRSGMSIRVLGVSDSDGRWLERRWTRIAEEGKGPWTPCLAVPLLARKLAAGELTPGAAPAVGLLTLAEFARSWEDLPFHSSRVDIARGPPLYARVMGADFDRLPPVVAAMHQVLGAAVVEGRGGVERGTNPLARFVAALMRFPAVSADGPVSVWFSEEAGVETWARRFGESGFQSRLYQRGALLVERFGPLWFGFALPVDSEGLSMALRQWGFGPIRLPLALAPRIAAFERAREERFNFDVSVSLPLIGLVVRYAGWLGPPAPEASPGAGRAMLARSPTGV